MFPLFLVVYLLENYSKYFDDYTHCLSGERSLTFGLLVSLLHTIDGINCGLVRMYFDTLSYLLDNILIRFGTKFYKQIVGIPMGTNYAPLVADLFLFCYDKVFWF